MLADMSADNREGVILPDKANRVLISSGLDKADIARNVDRRRTFRNTRNLLLLCAALSALDMADKVIAESIEAAQNHIRRFKADGAVRGGGNSLCSALYDVKRVHRRRAVKH